ncbi:hypothetical protein SGM_3256 [Streptomyces griseoaurantiacus M045]|uniref:Uncharacterized protein n=1 Tax=Streptomyces griseoaurantiacus M045 TaxID=996637 RepID=F3NJ67_9ACTN|nr:hypothetical protein SGM_3256 [Streptomyces griseoaurantiacus M045]
MCLTSVVGGGCRARAPPGSAFRPRAGTSHPVPPLSPEVRGGGPLHMTKKSAARRQPPEPTPRTPAV